MKVQQQRARQRQMYNSTLRHRRKHQKKEQQHLLKQQKKEQQRRAKFVEYVMKTPWHPLVRKHGQLWAQWAKRTTEKIWVSDGQDLLKAGSPMRQRFVELLETSLNEIASPTVFQGKAWNATIGGLPFIGSVENSRRYFGSTDIRPNNFQGSVGYGGTSEYLGFRNRTHKCCKNTKGKEWFKIVGGKKIWGKCLPDCGVNCCYNNCGAGTKYNGFPVMWDQDAIEPPPIQIFNERVNPPLERRPVLEHTVESAFMVQPATVNDFAAPCPVPRNVPKDSHMIRIASCGSEYENRGVFCALVKLTVGGNNVVDGWAKIYEPPISTKEIVKVYQSTATDGWSPSKAKACSSQRPPAFCEWQPPVASTTVRAKMTLSSKSSRRLLGSGLGTVRNKYTLKAKVEKMKKSLQQALTRQKKDDAAACAKAEGRTFKWSLDTCSMYHGARSLKSLRKLTDNYLDYGSCGRTANQLHGRKPLCDVDCCFLEKPPGGFTHEVRTERKYADSTETFKVGYHKSRLCQRREMLVWRRRSNTGRKRELGESVEQTAQSHNSNFGIGPSPPERDAWFKAAINKMLDGEKDTIAKTRRGFGRFFRRCIVNKGDETIRRAMSTLRFEAASKFLAGWRPSTSEKVPSWQMYEGSTKQSWTIIRDSQEHFKFTSEKRGLLLSYRKPTLQSSMSGHNHRSYHLRRKEASQPAVDGDISGVFSHKSCTHTKNESNPWWYVSLKTEATLKG